MIGNRNQLAKPDKKDILDKLSAVQEIDESYRPFGDGHVARRIVQTLDRYTD